jgi:hypothetical protein
MRSVSVVTNASGGSGCLAQRDGPSTFEPSASTPAVSIGAPSGIVVAPLPTELKFSSAKPTDR